MLFSLQWLSFFWLNSCSALVLLVGRLERHACKKTWGVVGVGASLVRMGWRPLGLPVPPLSPLAPQKNPEE